MTRADKMVPNYGVILFGPWKRDEDFALGNEKFKEFIHKVFNDLLPSFDDNLEERLSEAFGVPLSLSVYSVPESDTPPRFNVMSYVGPAWLSVVIDTIPSGAILESEFSRHAGLATLFLRIGSKNCSVCVKDFLCKSNNNSHSCSDDDFMTASSEMILDFTGTLHCTVVMSIELAKCAAKHGAKCDNAMIKEFLEVLVATLERLADQVRARYNAYRHLLVMRRNLNKCDKIKIDKFLKVAQ